MRRPISCFPGPRGRLQTTVERRAQRAIWHAEYLAEQARRRAEYDARHAAMVELRELARDPVGGQQVTVARVLETA